MRKHGLCRWVEWVKLGQARRELQHSLTFFILFIVQKFLNIARDEELKFGIFFGFDARIRFDITVKITSEFSGKRIYPSFTGSKRDISRPFYEIPRRN